MTAEVKQETLLGQMPGNAGVLNERRVASEKWWMIRWSGFRHAYVVLGKSLPGPEPQFLQLPCVPSSRRFKGSQAVHEPHFEGYHEFCYPKLLF